MPPSDSLTLKHRSRHQKRHLKCFSSKAMVKAVFLHNGGQCNVFTYVSRSNHSNHSKCFFFKFIFKFFIYLFIAQPRPKLPCVKRMYDSQMCLNKAISRKCSYVIAVVPYQKYTVVMITICANRKIKYCLDLEYSVTSVVTFVFCTGTKHKSENLFLCFKYELQIKLVCNQHQLS